ncbi:ABC transporter ATP-binding protein [Candidatus Roizmanbacteria bacterium RIFCSPLOWO2_01_FULL_42_14]|uniref:ABC transporter ATP-binding protein n=2 Tax=Candidatus Roizmaniibacteriota TaxID=1752723 RepID=A0A1F7JVJ8_9BACT|nr:MAG: ABC transporter ATP-binding protein [Candidatus Roizmanbacteria bacterium RIFCSPLOWO2_01_FULL_42_14]OGK59643.1 MAG: ABC transporter ATP-binding protein [Candidatus Roizmanbacteria bacterium RIFCSPLOWO2_02_FULL_43_10]
MSMIKLVNVYKKFTLGNEELTILKNINLHIQEHEFMAILGPSGSGKSTLMYILGLLDTPTSGKVFIRDIDVAKLSDDATSKLRNKFIGFVFQQFNLINKLTVLENILLPSVYRSGPLDFNPTEKAWTLMKRFGIDHRAKSYPNKISGGEQQRVSIARALILDPDVILADEPTGNLDSKTGHIILELLQDLNQRDKKTVLIITHDKTIAAMTKKQIALMDGEIIKHV